MLMPLVMNERSSSMRVVERSGVKKSNGGSSGKDEGKTFQLVLGVKGARIGRDMDNGLW